MDGIKLSIVVLVYNLEKYLPRCLDALLAQTLKETEIICVNDGSPDNSQAIIDGYAFKYPQKIKRFVKENGGEWSTRNYGLERARGEYITFVDNDDLPDNRWAEKLYDAAVRYDADMAVCAFERVDIDTGLVKGVDMKWPEITAFDVTGGEYRSAFVNPAPWNKIYRLSKIKDLRFLPIRGFSDMCFYTSALLYINRIVIVPEVLYHYFIRSDSQIHSIENSDVENAKSALLSVKELYDISPGGDEFRQLLDFMAYIHLGISIMYRVSYSNAVRTREITRGVISYLDGNFPSWRRSKFLKLGFVLNKGPKYIGLWGIAWFYKHNMEMVFINTYRFVHDKLKIDIKW
jgi:glycosyltransferase involved in cell wall biosynthesis